jgi:hypothetical protein
MPLRPEGAATAAHIIGHKRLIRLLPKLDLTSFPCSNAAALALRLRLRALRSMEILDVASYRREDLINPFLHYLRHAPKEAISMTFRSSMGVHLKHRSGEKLRLFVSTLSTLHQMHGTLQQQNGRVAEGSVKGISLGWALATSPGFRASEGRLIVLRSS